MFFLMLILGRLKAGELMQPFLKGVGKKPELLPGSWDAMFITGHRMKRPGLL